MEEGKAQEYDSLEVWGYRRKAMIPDDAEDQVLILSVSSTSSSYALYTFS